MMDNINIITKYFENLSELQLQQFAMMSSLYNEWNSKINVISRKDIDFLYEHHVLHSLAIAKIIKFRPQTRVLDLGTGGGFPGIPLAIMFPETKFKLIDGTGKKIMVVKEVAKAIKLENCVAEQLRGENETGKYDFVVSRAVMPLPELVNLVKKNVASPQHNSLPNGLLCLKGGNITNEIKPYKKIADITDLGNIFEEEWFKQKFMVYIPL